MSKQESTTASFTVRTDYHPAQELAPVESNKQHHVLYKLPYIKDQTPKPHPEKWKEVKESKGFVKMPCSDKIKQYDVKASNHIHHIIINKSLRYLINILFYRYRLIKCISLINLYLLLTV
jgi:hypothetical protein